jgi:hypothetical protein
VALVLQQQFQYRLILAFACNSHLAGKHTVANLRRLPPVVLFALARAESTRAGRILWGE